jgi:predicted O-methyltransferase YrrM
VVRERILANLLGVTRARIHRSIVECRPIKRSVFDSLRRQQYAGTMDARKYEILYALTRILDARTVVETGVASGASSAFILYALAIGGKNGRLTSIDLGSREFDGIALPLDKPIGWLVPEHLRQKWKLVMGSSKDQLLKVLQRIECVDIFLHDSDHSYSNMIYEYSLVWPFLRAGGMIISDNIEWNDAFRDFCRAWPCSAAELYGLGIIVKK